MTEINVTENRQKVRDLIASLPAEKFDMGSPTTGGCGSPACIMGWTETLMQPAPHGWQHIYQDEIEAWLGLDTDEGNRLFYPSGLIPLGNGRRVYAATPAEAVRVLDHLIATGEVNWSVASQSEADQ